MHICLRFTKRKTYLPSSKQGCVDNMADSAVHFLVLWVIVSALFQTPEIQAQSTTILASSSISARNASLFMASGSMTASLFSLNSSFTSQPSSTSSSLINAQSTQLISRDIITSQVTAANNVAPTTSQVTRSTVSPSESVTVTSSTTAGPKSDDKEDEDRFTTTEYMLIACLCTFGLIFIAVIVLVVQIARLNKSVSHLKATSRR